MRFYSVLVGAVLCWGLSAAWAAEPMEGEAVTKQWPMAAGWPVVDARSDQAAERRPIPKAIPFQEGLSLEAKAVVVVAGDGQRAAEVATALEKAHPDLRAVPLRDGFKGLKALRGGQMYKPQTTSSALPSGSNTPSGTCKPGEPLHTFDGDGEGDDSSGNGV